MLVVGIVLLGGAAAWAWLNRAPDNSDILRIAHSIPAGAGYCSLKESGIPETVNFKGVKILGKSKSGGTYCCGYTFWVAFKAARERGLLKYKEPYDLARFQHECYGSSRQSAEREIAMAMEDLGIGRQIDPNDAQAGDFATFQRDGIHAGHSVIFLNYVRHNGIIVGVHYLSSQPTTHGVGEETEYFGSSGYSAATILDPKRFYVCRLNRR